MNFAPFAAILAPQTEPDATKRLQRRALSTSEGPWLPAREPARVQPEVLPALATALRRLRAATRPATRRHRRSCSRGLPATRRSPHVNLALALVLALASALALNWGFYRQHEQASSLPPLSLRRPARSLRSLFRNTRWFVGFVGRDHRLDLLRCRAHLRSALARPGGIGRRHRDPGPARLALGGRHARAEGVDRGGRIDRRSSRARGLTDRRRPQPQPLGRSQLLGRDRVLARGVRRSSRHSSPGQVSGSSPPAQGSASAQAFSTPPVMWGRKRQSRAGGGCSLFRRSSRHTGSASSCSSSPSSAARLLPPPV